MLHAQPVSETESKPFFVPWPKVIDRMGATRGAIRRACVKHGIPVVEISRKQGGLTEEAMKMLMSRVTKPVK